MQWVNSDEFFYIVQFKKGIVIKITNLTIIKYSQFPYSLSQLFKLRTFALQCHLQQAYVISMPVNVSHRIGPCGSSGEQTGRTLDECGYVNIASISSVSSVSSVPSKRSSQSVVVESSSTFAWLNANRIAPDSHLDEYAPVWRIVWCAHCNTVSIG